MQVDPTGKQVGPPISVDPGTVGDNVKLTIDINVQAAAEKALERRHRRTRRTTRTQRSRPTYTTLHPTGGAVVVLNVHDGSVVAMASNPTYPLSWWVGGISTDHFALLSAPGAHNPLLNRVTEGQYAPGSTFKLVPSIALNQYNVFGAASYVLRRRGHATFENTFFQNDNGEQNGEVNLQKALTVSSDVYFYNAGNEFWKRWKLGDTTTGLGIQTVAGQLGFGKPTGIELDEASGRIPDPTWKPAFANANNKTKAAKIENGKWTPGDNILAAVGQGDDFVTPLQLANAYATFANAASSPGPNGNTGTVWTPHVGQLVTNPNTKQVVQIMRAEARRARSPSPVSCTDRWRPGSRASCRTRSAPRTRRSRA